MTRYFHLGLDYGTSASKMIFRDPDAPGGERAFVIQDPVSGYRFPSCVHFDRATDELHFGQRSGHHVGPGLERYDSVKMRVAEEAKGGREHYFFGRKEPFPDGLDAAKLAVLTVWHHLSVGDAHMREYAKRKPFEATVSMGIPMSFFADEQIRRAFLGIIRAGQWLSKNRGPMDARRGLKRGDAIRQLEFALDEIRKEKIVEDEVVRSWLRAEAEAGLIWAYNSPALGDGLYAKIDVGAGTTNVSVFMIMADFDERHQRWVKSGMAFFQAGSAPCGMDAIVHAIGGTGISAGSDAIRENEDRFYRGLGINSGPVDIVMREVYDLYQGVWQQSYSKYPNQSHWRTMRLFVFGGGGQFRVLVKRMTPHPDRNWTSSGQNFGQWALMPPPVPLVRLNVPGDLSMGGAKSAPTQKDLSFLLVAYGLSYDELSIPKVKSPHDMVAVPPPIMGRRHRQIEDHETVR